MADDSYVVGGTWTHVLSCREVYLFGVRICSLWILMEI